MTKQPVMLMILDGWGIAPPSDYNAATLASTPNLTKLLATCPHTTLRASGEDVGLPEGQMGNSEVGHLNIGSGRIVYQELTRITKSIKDGDFFTNEELVAIMETTKSNDKALHLLGLVSDGGVHSHLQHLIALVEMAKNQGVERVYVHAFLDGRDVAPRSALEYLHTLEVAMKEVGIGQIATVSGRYYAMDRDKRWDRVEQAYKNMTEHTGRSYASAIAGVEASYQEGITDEFVVPFYIGDADTGRVQAGDGMIFFNFRPDRAREITRAFVDEEFPHFPRTAAAYPVNFLCMTQYDVTIAAPVAFKPQLLVDTLGETIAKRNLRQLRIAETEKYAHVTFFFNGGVEAPNINEERILIPSPKVATYDLQPEMSARLVTTALMKELDENNNDLIILNFANPDMVGHTGNLSAAIQAMEVVDECVGMIVTKMQEIDGTVFITADHGNLEQMEDPTIHTPFTAHTTNLVNFIMVANNNNYTLQPGRLADIAPTILEVMEIKQPEAMTGASLLVK